MGAMTGLLLLLWAGVTVGSVLDLQKRIIGGRDCRQGERDYHVVLKTHIRNGRESLCGGSLISNQWILTTAHCWIPKWTITAYVGRSPEGVVITERVVYKDKNRKTHDIMLLKLPDPTTITPVELPECTSPLKLGEEVQIAGYGDTPGLVNDLLSKPLTCATTNVVDCEKLQTCLDNAGDDLATVLPYQHLLCYGSATVDASNGDSGGGVVVNGRIYGVHSINGVAPCTIPSASMDVCKYKAWIKLETGI